MAICIQRKFGVPAEVVTPQMFEATLDDAEVARRVVKAREYYQQGKKNEYTREKSGLPGFIFSCGAFVAHEYVDTKGKKHPKDTWAHQEWGLLNGLFMVDLDHLENPRQVWHDIISHKAWEEEYKERTFFSFVTCSDHGLKIVMACSLEDGNLASCQNRFCKTFGLPNDKSTKNSNRLSFAPSRADVLYYRPELHTYCHKAWADKYAASYAKGISEPDIFKDEDDEKDKKNEGKGQKNNEVVKTEDEENEDFENYRYDGLAIGEIIEEWMKDKTLKNNRHKTLLMMCKDLKYVCDRKDALVMYYVNKLAWVKELRQEGDPVDKTIEDGLRYRMNAMMPKRLYAIVKQLQKEKGLAPDEVDENADCGNSNDVEKELFNKFVAYGQEIEQMAPLYPCMPEVCYNMQTSTKPACVFVASALFGTLMTRTWYHFFHSPEKERRLNYEIFIVDDPGMGKSFAEDLYKVILSPVIASDQVGIDRINLFKKEQNKIETSSDKNKRDGLVQPEVKIRIHGSRTSNQTFIEDMVNCTDVVGDKLMHLHLFTFDSELENANRLSSGSQSWMDKSVFELKAFHNEEDNQQYKNKDSISGRFNVFWNFVYTGTPVSLHKKVTPRNFGSGLFGRLAVLPQCANKYYVMPLMKQSKKNQDVIDELKKWAFRLDEVKGELPIWPLVETTHAWIANTIHLAEMEQDEVSLMLSKRVPYYGLHIAIPFILMRHWDEWTKERKMKFDETDKKLVNLILEIQMTCQKHFFGGLCRTYLENKNAEEQANKMGYNSKSRRMLEMLPLEFDYDAISKMLDNDDNKTRVQIWRWCEDKLIAKIGRGKKAKFKKI